MKIFNRRATAGLLKSPILAAALLASAFVPDSLHGQQRSARPFEDPRTESSLVPERSAAADKTKMPKSTWSVSTQTGSKVSDADLRGRPALLVFYRGLECSHCRKQLAALDRKREAFDSRKIAVLAISPFLPTPGKDDANAVSAWYPLGSDPDLEVFRRFGFADDNNIPTHGVVLIDAEGAVLWKDAGDTARLDIDKILDECDRRLKRRG